MSEHLIEVDRMRYRALLRAGRAELHQQIDALHECHGRIVIVVEGRDGAGKTGAIMHCLIEYVNMAKAHGNRTWVRHQSRRALALVSPS